jgi:hypothetical protein
MGYEVSFKLKRAEGMFAGCGEWAQPNRAEIVAAMRRVHRDRREAQRLGRAGARKVKRLSWTKANTALLAPLKKMEVLSDGKVAKPRNG